VRHDSGKEDRKSVVSATAHVDNVLVGLRWEMKRGGGDVCVLAKAKGVRVADPEKSKE
jgi:hypothetical protein